MMCRLCGGAITGRKRIYCSDRCRIKFNDSTERRKEYRKKYTQTPIAIYKFYKVNSDKRDIEFPLDFDGFMSLWGTDCHYCGSSIKTIGIDRVDNNIGYTSSNIVSCCKICNFMKSNLSEKDFIEHIAKIYNNR